MTLNPVLFFYRLFTTGFLAIFLCLGIGGCGHHKKPEPLIPPEPVNIKEDMAAASASSADGLSLSKAADQEWQQYKGDAVYRLGKPYKVNGIWYFPAENMKYDEIGFASWYGDKFHNRQTANGEIFDKNGLTAAHKTLPLPSVVRVTNLENNKSVVVRINDRGPFVNDRLIDLSERAAQTIGAPSTGMIKVRVEILPNESATVAHQVRDHINPVAPAPFAPMGEPANVPPSTEAPASSPDLSQATQDLFDAGPAAQTNPLGGESSPPEPPAEPIPEPVPDQPVPAATSKTFVVQVGTFRQQQNASTLSQKLAIVGPTSITPLPRNGETLYRVQSGPFTDRIQAQNALHHIKSLGIHDAKILEKTS